MMNSYDLIAPFYDAGTADRSAMVSRLRSWIPQRPQDDVRVLELGCGTASILNALPKRWDLWGIDLSQGMLRRARQKVPRGHFSRQDMTQFRLPVKFDVLLCVLDSINHITTFVGWKRLFRTVREHLADGGVFIFDVYTIEKLRRLANDGPFLERIGRDYFTVAGSYRRGFLNCDVKIFSNAGNRLYRLVKTTVAERAFPLQQIHRALRRNFDSIALYGDAGQKPSESCERIYFVCRKPNKEPKASGTENETYLRASDRSNRTSHR
jgi:SAM-dependent methyltransferase